MTSMSSGDPTQDRRWKEALMKSAEAVRARIEAVIANWSGDEQLAAAGFSKEEHGVVAERLQRTVTGFEHVVMNQRPAVPYEQSRFKIDWSAGGIGCWVEPSRTAGFSILDAFRDTAKYMGEYDEGLKEMVARRLFADLQSGRLELTSFERDPKSSDSVTWLRPVPPCINLEGERIGRRGA